MAQIENQRSIVDALHQIDFLKTDDFFIQATKNGDRIAHLEKGIMRSFHIRDNGEESNSHFYMEGDLIIPTLIPNIPALISIQAMENCRISSANYQAVIAEKQKNKIIRDIIEKVFQELQKRLQLRISTLQNLAGIERYRLFLVEYPNLINRIPHYHVANFLGITCTQLSRVRRKFIYKCK